MLHNRFTISESFCVCKFASASEESRLSSLGHVDWIADNSGVLQVTSRFQMFFCFMSLNGFSGFLKSELDVFGCLWGYLNFLKDDPKTL